MLTTAVEGKVRNLHANVTDATVNVSIRAKVVEVSVTIIPVDGQTVVSGTVTRIR